MLWVIYNTMLFCSPQNGTRMQTLCVFCGSSAGTDPELAVHTQKLATFLVQRGIHAVCGGSQKGLMEILIDTMLDQNGQITGVYPITLTKQQPPHPRLTHCIETQSLFDRKEKMLAMSDAFLVLPGAYGTLDEWYEIMVLTKIHALTKPIFVYNFKGFWDSSLTQMAEIERCGFATPDAREAMKVCTDLHQLFHALEKQCETEAVMA